MARVALAQMASSSSLEDNFNTIEDLAQKAREAKADLLALPEECLTLGMLEKDKWAVSQDVGIEARLSALAKAHEIWVLAGSVPVAHSKTHYYATSLLFDAQGHCQGRYQKLHLFDVHVDEATQYEESKTVTPGETLAVIPSPLGQLGLSICYDVRFPELYRSYAGMGAQVLMVPSAFTPQTGRVHWHTLLKARAIENLCYVVAPNQVGQRPSGQGTYGHSLIVGPWGDILVEKKAGVGVMVADLDLGYLKKIRKRFPVLEHSRFEQTLRTL